MNSVKKGNNKKSVPTSSNIKAIDLVCVATPLLILLLLSLPLRDWLIDDAGITFAYARSLAMGDGLVAQPGQPAVEGYSNFLWLVILSVTMLIRLFEPYLTAKILGLLFGGGTFILLYSLVLRITDSNRLAAFGASFLLAINTSFIVWTCSGLENSLYAFLCLLLMYLMWHLIHVDIIGHRWPIAIGLTALLISLTRPDGVVYSLLIIPALLIRSLPTNIQTLRQSCGVLMQYVATFGAGYGAFLMFRFYYFGCWQPNTYYAKGGPSSSQLFPALTLQGQYLDKFKMLSASVFGEELWIVLPALTLTGLILSLAWKDHWRDPALIGIFTFTSYYIFLLLPTDWMGEFRFATPFFGIYYCLIAILITLVTNRTNLSRIWKTIAVSTILALLMAMSINDHYPRWKKFCAGPVVAMERIAQRFAFPYIERAALLDNENPSILTPDIGAMLYYSKLRVFDLAGLIDPVIARTLRSDKAAFYDYVFETARPSFIHVHGNWTLAARLDDDPRFRRDYVPINEHLDVWIKNQTGLDMMSGDYVRTEAVAGHPDLLEGLRNVK